MTVGEGTGEYAATVTIPYIRVWVDDNWFNTYGLASSEEVAADAFMEGDSLWVVGWFSYADGNLGMAFLECLDLGTGGVDTERSVLIRSESGILIKPVAVAYDEYSRVAYISGNIEDSIKNEYIASFVMAFNTDESEVLWFTPFQAGVGSYVTDVALIESSEVWVTGSVSLTDVSDKDVLIARFQTADGSPIGAMGVGTPDADEVGQAIASRAGRTFVAGYRESSEGGRDALIMYMYGPAVLWASTADYGGGSEAFSDVGILYAEEPGGVLSPYVVAVGRSERDETRPLIAEWKLTGEGLRKVWGYVLNPWTRDAEIAIPSEAAALTVMEDHEEWGADWALISGWMRDPGTGRSMAYSLALSVDGFSTMGTTLKSYGDLFGVRPFMFSRYSGSEFEQYLYLVGTTIDIAPYAEGLSSRRNFFVARFMISRYTVTDLAWRVCPSAEGVHIDTWSPERFDVETEEIVLTAEAAELSPKDVEAFSRVGAVPLICNAMDYYSITLTASPEYKYTVTTTVTVTDTIVLTNLSVTTLTEEHYQTVTKTEEVTKTQEVIGTCSAQSLEEFMGKEAEQSRLLYITAGIGVTTLAAILLLAISRRRP